MTIHVFGRIFMDLFIYGESVHTSTIIETPGGSGLNASLGFSLLGYETYIHAACGNDAFGHQIKSLINRYGVKTKYLIQQCEPTNRFICRNSKAIAASISTDPATEMPCFQTNDDYCLVFATETSQDILEKALKVPWKGLFIDLGPKYAYIPFQFSLKDAIVIGNEREAEKNLCDVIKLGKNGARWHDIFVPGNGQSLQYTTGAGDLFDVVFVDNFLKGTSQIETMRKAVFLSQKACMIPGSSTKVQILRDLYHSV